MPAPSLWRWGASIITNAVNNRKVHKVRYYKLDTMAERESNLAEFHATEVQPWKDTHQDMAGGTEDHPINTLPVYTDREKDDDPGAPSETSMDEDEPTEEELATLPHVADKLPWSAYLVAVIELCERFAYYGINGTLQNYIENPYGDPKLPGGIGLGQTGATGLTNFFQFWCYVTPILGAIVSDQYLGKYKTILVFSVVYVIGTIILFLTSLPMSIQNNAALGGLITAMIVIGLGTGGIKSNVSPLIAEQYRGTKSTIRTLKNGQRVIIDPAVTIQRIYMIFYLCINVGSLSAIATTELELHVGFWSAYLLPMLMFFIGFFVLIAGRKKYVVRPPKGSVIIHAFKVLWIAATSFNLEAAKPAYQNSHGRKQATPWDDLFVDEIRRALVACRIFVFFPIYWVTYSQMYNNFVSQAGTMQLHGIPNDIMQNIDPITIIIFIPILDRLVYPALRKVGIKFKPITRITFGFFFGALAMAYAAIVQRLIYNSPPCYSAASDCDEGNQIHVAVQAPGYLFIGLSEIFASITGLEYAYTKAPPSMKSFVMSVFLLMNAFGSALGIALSPTAVDPKLVWMYTGLAVAALLAGIAFWLLFNRYNATEEEMNQLDAKGVQAEPATEVETVVAARRQSEVDGEGDGDVGQKV
ncbi:MAG: peptide transporter ptr2 [Piccolia ochrophora]|nr:MAG: peptide transporter ptr2 [Piccolia ochrophora]